MINRNDGFGGLLKQGKHLETLNKAKRFFDTKDVHLTRYFFSRETPERVETFVPKELLTDCEICGAKLYKFVEPDQSAWSTSSRLVRHKRHLVFVDHSGKQHKTCYKLNSCLKSVGLANATSEVRSSLKVLDYWEFLGMDKEPTPTEEVEEFFWRGYSTSYSTKVVPFLFRWYDTEINKTNVIQFVTEFEAMLSEHLLYFGDDASGIIPKAKIKNKILKIIGVKT